MGLLCLYPHCSCVKALRDVWVSFWKQQTQTICFEAKMYHAGKCVWMMHQKLTFSLLPMWTGCCRWKGGLYIYLFMKKIKIELPNLVFGSAACMGTLVKEASALMQSDCCFSHDHVSKYIWKHSISRYLYPIKVPLVFYSNWTRFST